MNAKLESNIRKLDAAADSMKAEMNAARRRIESSGYVMVCECGKEAAPRSCYCEECEAKFYDE